jgi:hypothetical protein
MQGGWNGGRGGFVWSLDSFQGFDTQWLILGKSVSHTWVQSTHEGTKHYSLLFM